MTRQPAERGQVLVIVALAIVVLLGASAFTIDLGRQAAEERFLQNAADAGALAGCNALVDGATEATALQRAREIATTNLASSPAGTSASIAPSGSEEFVDGHHGNPYQLVNGAVYDAASISIFVALDSDLGTTVGRVLGRETLGAAGRARCTLEPQPMLPLVARRYTNPPGPAGGFVDHLATSTTSPDGAVDATDPRGYDGRTPASELEPGPEFQVFGPGSQATNNSFRGFVALDVRDFTGETSRQYYNGADSTMNANTLKNHHAQYVTEPYPGPAIPAVQSPPTGATQIGILNGVTAAHSTEPFGNRFTEGARLLLAVYNGTVMSIPDFSIQPPGEIALPENTGGTPVDGPSFRVSRNNAFSSSVDLSLVGDAHAADPDHDILQDPTVTPPSTGQMDEPAFSPNNFVPGNGAGTLVAMESISTNDVPPGIYTVWIEGQAGPPYNQARRQSVPVRIGTVSRDFDLQGTFDGETATLGGTIDLGIRVVRKGSAWHDGASTDTTPVQLSWEDLTTCNYGPVVIGTATIGISPSSVTPTTSGANATVSISSGSLSAGCYLFTLRASGVNADGQPVTRVQEVEFSVAAQSGPSDYVDIIGFSVFEITHIGTNEIWGQAITGIYADPADLALKAALRPRLIPWND